MKLTQNKSLFLPVAHVRTFYHSNKEVTKTSSTQEDVYRLNIINIKELKHDLVSVGLLYPYPEGNKG